MSSYTKNTEKIQNKKKTRKAQSLFLPVPHMCSISCRFHFKEVGTAIKKYHHVAELAQEAHTPI